ncbi:MAG: DegT/DnrJ/EryC1/StrS family aminotransferase [Victivallales bacterium]|nr:DegT/DnrJ/EryC1/StrS family aminotransferase [Victivallales bacterium]
MTYIPVCEPYLNGNELEYVTEAVAAGWISSSGKYVSRFEESFAEYCGAKYAVAVCNGTAALHLGLAALGIGKGDEVIIPSFTMAASAFAVCYTGAMPVFVDADKYTWNIDVNRIEEKITPRTKAVMPVSIFGHPAEMDAIREIAAGHRLALIEDAAESHGAEYKGIKVGNLADITAFSFFSNKNLTTGEGGMVVTGDKNLYEQSRYYRNMCFPLNGPRNYRHRHIGFNYRMSNLHAAIGLAQVEKAEEYIALRVKNGALYRRYLEGIDGVISQGTLPHVRHAQWMNGVIIEKEKYGKDRDELMAHLAENKVETRLFFAGMQQQQSLLDYGCTPDGDYPVTEYLTENGFYLPSASSLSEEKIKFICGLIRDFRG